MKYSYEEYAVIFKALGDATRIEILQMLKDKELCGCHILSKFNITQPTLSYHMKTLKDGGLIVCRKKGSWMHYSLNRERIRDIEELMKEVRSNCTEGVICKK